MFRHTWQNAVTPQPSLSLQTSAGIVATPVVTAVQTQAAVATPTKQVIQIRPAPQVTQIRIQPVSAAPGNSNTLQRKGLSLTVSGHASLIAYLLLDMVTVWSIWLRIEFYDTFERFVLSPANVTSVTTIPYFTVCTVTRPLSYVLYVICCMPLGLSWGTPAIKPKLN
jgi:hypothetical protein